jgi:phage terminase large subunit-like protein
MMKSSLLAANTKQKPILTNVVIVDPAKTVELHSADSAIVGWGIDRTSKRMYFRDCVADRFYPDQLYDEMFAMVVRLKATILAIEVTSLHEFIVQPIKNEMRKRGIFPLLLELNATGKKEERIAWLAPFYRQGYIYHNPAICQKLEQQLLTFPRARKFDVMDAAAYIVKVMEKEAIYFDPVDLPDGADEYAELENEPAFDQTSCHRI